MIETPWNSSMVWQITYECTQMSVEFGNIATQNECQVHCKGIIYTSPIVMFHIC
jgi:hypothetical protein